MTEEAFERFGGCIVAAHIDDYRVEGGSVIRCNIDEGDLPVAQILATIDAHAPYLAVIMEETVDDAIGRTVARYAESGFSK
jgi:sugar phosphate isomerase/epimerase